MSAGRPPLRIGRHGTIKRINLGAGEWLARCRYRDLDGIVRVVERRGPKGVQDQYGKAAEENLLEALAARRGSLETETGLDTPIVALVDRHIDRLEEDGRATRTIDTYRLAAKYLGKIIAGVRVGEATPARLDAAIRAMHRAHGDVLAVQAKTLLKGALHLAVMATVLASNPVRDISPIQSKRGPKGSKALTTNELRALLKALPESEYCQKYDLVDPITMLIGTGLRRSELLGLQWPDYNPGGSTLTVSGKLIRAAGKGLMREDFTKTAAGQRVILLPTFVAAMLEARRSKPFIGDREMIFPSSAGTWRDPDNFNARWGKARIELGVPDITSHSFRKSVATLIDEGGLSARKGADQLGHARVSETQDVYMARGRVHPEIAEMLDQALKNDE